MRENHEVYRFDGEEYIKGEPVPPGTMMINQMAVCSSPTGDKRIVCKLNGPAIDGLFYAVCISRPIDIQDGACESKIVDGGHVFPHSGASGTYCGITLREYVAVKIMASLVRGACVPTAPETKFSDAKPELFVVCPFENLAKCACDGAQALVDEMEGRKWR